MDPLAWIDEELERLESLGLRRRLQTRQAAQRPGELRLDERPLVNFSSNDYLGLAAHPELIRAVERAVAEHGWGSGASPLVTGRGMLQARLEVRLAEFEATEAALLFPSGFAANAGTLAALAGPGDVVYSDARNHASIIDGCRLSRARVVVYPHADAGALARLLADTAAAHRRRLIVTDALFSMDGDLAPLAELAELADRHRAMLMVDEAHATGVFGATGRGVSEQLGVERGVHVRVGTLSKALGSAGGFVAGSRPLIDWLANRARSYVFSTAPPEPWAAAALAALEIVRREPQRRERLRQLGERVREALRRGGRDVGRSTSQIIPVILGSPERALELAGRLRARGLLVPAIRPPSVPDGQSLLRISLSSAHPDAAVDELADSLRTGG